MLKTSTKYGKYIKLEETVFVSCRGLKKGVAGFL
jgi:hypothetical protein